MNFGDLESIYQMLVQEPIYSVLHLFLRIAFG